MLNIDINGNLWWYIFISMLLWWENVSIYPRPTLITYSILYYWVFFVIKTFLWPFPSGPEGNDDKQPLYPGFERDVLRTVADYYQRLKEPLLTFHLYEVFVNILSEYFMLWTFCVIFGIFGNVILVFGPLRDQDSSLFLLLQAYYRSRIKPWRLFKSAACCCHRPTGDGSSSCCASWLASAAIPICHRLMTLLLPEHWYVFPHTLLFYCTQDPFHRSV